MSVRDLRRQEELRKETAKLETKRQHEEKSREAQESTLMQEDDRKRRPDKETKKDSQERTAMLREDVRHPWERNTIDEEPTEDANRQAAQSGRTNLLVDAPPLESATTEKQEMEAPEPFYKVQSRAFDESPDPRAKRELCLEISVHRIRDFPTLPADPDDVNEVWQAALSDDLVVDLPTAHTVASEAHLECSQ